VPDILFLREKDETSKRLDINILADLSTWENDLEWCHSNPPLLGIFNVLACGQLFANFGRSTGSTLICRFAVNRIVECFASFRWTDTRAMARYIDTDLIAVMIRVIGFIANLYSRAARLETKTKNWKINITLHFNNLAKCATKKLANDWSLLSVSLDFFGFGEDRILRGTRILREPRGRLS